MQVKRRGGNPKLRWSHFCAWRRLLLPQYGYFSSAVGEDSGIPVSLPAWTSGWCCRDALCNDKCTEVSWCISMKESLLLPSLGDFPLDFDSIKAYLHACTHGDGEGNSSQIKVLKSLIFCHLRLLLSVMNPFECKLKVLKVYLQIMAQTPEPKWCLM